MKNIKKETLAKLSMVFSMALFGTIGLFVKYIGMPSGFIALIRGLTAAAFIFVIMLVIVGILHTGIAYTVYFGSINYVKAQSTAVISYIDPVVAVLLSVFVLKENITPAGVIGAAAVLISTLISELPKKTKSENIIN